jgi:hypothetical protein
LGGTVAVAAVSLAASIPMALLWLRITEHLSPGSGDSYFVVTHWHTLRVVGAAIAIFAAGFYGQFRRSRRQGRLPNEAH